MAKLTTAQIREQERKRLTKQLEQKYSNLINDKDRFKNAYHKQLEATIKLRHENQDLKEKNTELEEKVRQYEDWVRRLHEFMELPEDQRSDAFKTYCEEMKRSQEFHDLTNVYLNMFNRLFIF